MIDSKYIVSRGDMAKYRIGITHTDFDQQRDDYRVVLTWGMFGESKTISKADMAVDEDNNAYMMFDSSGMLGWVKASCHYDVEDSDADSGYREEVDYQWLCFVSADPVVRLYCEFEPGGDGHVTYTRVYGGDVNTAYLNLRDSSQQNLLDSEGNQLRVHKTESDYQDK